MQEHVVCFMGGMIVALVVFVIIWAPWSLPDKALVLQCRERVERFHALSAGEQQVWLEKMRADPALHTRWKATCVLNNAFGGTPIDVP